MSHTSNAVASRLARLADVLAELKSRVRQAVAGETGRAVGEAVRDLLTAIMSGSLTSSRPAYGSPRSGWDDDPERWDDEYDRDNYEIRRPPAEVRPQRTALWPTAVTAGAAAVRWWISRKVSGWAAMGLGLLVGAAAAVGGPIARAGLALVAAAADLVPAVHPFAEWGVLLRSD